MVPLPKKVRTVVDQMIRLMHVVEAHISFAQEGSAAWIENQSQHDCAGNLQPHS
jgi:hypothetical protein